MKEWFKKHWKELLIAILTAILAVLSACGSTWKLEGNQININNQNKNQNDTVKNEVRKIPQKRVGKKRKASYGKIQRRTMEPAIRSSRLRQWHNASRIQERNELLLVQRSSQSRKRNAKKTYYFINNQSS
nr:MAG TPA: protein of unknown function (DUF4969) [Microviridae sp.]